MKYHIINLSKEEFNGRNEFETFFTVPEIAKIIKNQKNKLEEYLEMKKFNLTKYGKVIMFMNQICVNI